MILSTYTVSLLQTLPYCANSAIVPRPLDYGLRLKPSGMRATRWRQARIARATRDRY